MLKLILLKILFQLTHSQAQNAEMISQIFAYDTQLIYESNIPSDIDSYEESLQLFSMPLYDCMVDFEDGPQPYGVGLSIQELSIQISPDSEAISFGLQITQVIKDSQKQVELSLSKNENIIINRLAIQYFWYNYQGVSDEVEIKQITLKPMNATQNRGEYKFWIRYNLQKQTEPQVMIHLNGLGIQVENTSQVSFSIEQVVSYPYGFEFKLVFREPDVQLDFLIITYITTSIERKDKSAHSYSIGLNKTIDTPSMQSTQFSNYYYDVSNFSLNSDEQADITLRGLILTLTNYVFMWGSETNFQIIKSIHQSQTIQTFFSSSIQNDINNSFNINQTALIIIRCANYETLSYDSLTQTYRCSGICINNLTRIANPQPGQTFLVLNGQYCACSPGYYLRDLRCYKCDISCQDCKGPSEYECLSCSDKLRIFYQYVCFCPSGYYESKYRNCLKCHIDCINCKGSSEYDCFSCRDQNSYVSGDFKTKQFESEQKITDQQKLFAMTFNQSQIYGYCACNPGFYQLNSRCTKCHFTCYRCRGTSYHDCIECPKTRELRSGVCLCKEGYFEIGQSNQIYLQNFDQIFPEQGQAVDTFLSDYKVQVFAEQECYPCYTNCKQCLGYSETNCTLCQQNMVLKVINHLYLSGECVCQGQYFMDQYLSCSLCEVGCKYCIRDTVGSCKECLAPYRLFIQDTLFLTGYCICPPKYAPQLPCRVCHESCLECTGTAENECSACDKNRLLFLTWDGTCDCQKGYYKDQQKCYVCNHTCETCNNEFDCLTCNINRISPPQCYCDEGYYLSQEDQECHECYAFCQTCNGPSEFDCKSCRFNLEIEKSQSNGSCQCIDQKQIYSFQLKQCIQEVQFHVSFEFDYVNHKQYIDLTFSEELFIPKLVVDRYQGLLDDYKFVEQIHENMINKTGKAPRVLLSPEEIYQDLGFQFTTNMPDISTNASYLNSQLLRKRILKNWLILRIDGIDDCLIQFDVIQISNFPTFKIQLEVEYFFNLVDRNLSIFFSQQQRLYTRTLSSLPSRYLQPNHIVIQFGPYHTVDSILRNHLYYEWLAQNFQNYKDRKMQETYIYKIIRTLALLPIFIPSTQAVMTLFQLSSNISINSYFYFSMIGFGYFPDIIEYSSQNIPRDVVLPDTVIGISHNPSAVRNHYQQLPPQLNKLYYTGVFIIDQEGVVLVWVFCFVFKFVIDQLYKSDGYQNNRQTLNRLSVFINWLFIKITKQTLYSILLSLFMEVNGVGKDLLYQMSFFAVTMIALIQIITIVMSLKHIHQSDNIDFIINEVEYEGHHVRMQPRRINQIKYTKQELLDVNKTTGIHLDVRSEALEHLIKSGVQNHQDSLYSEDDQYKINSPFIGGIAQIPQSKRGFKYYALSKRVLMAIFVSVCKDKWQSSLLQLMIVCQSFYIFFKFFLQPYKSLRTYTIKLAGDICFFIAILSTFQQEKHLRELYQHSLSSNHICSQEHILYDYNKWLPVIQEGWVCIYASSLFIVLYMVEDILELFSNTKQTINLIGRRKKKDPVDIQVEKTPLIEKQKIEKQENQIEEIQVEGNKALKPKSSSDVQSQVDIEKIEDDKDEDIGERMFDFSVFNY